MPLPLDAADIDARARAVRALMLDVDGVLTDGRVIVLPTGDEGRTFNVRDALGVQLLQASDVPVALVSGRESPVIRRRAADLGIARVYLGQDKVEAFEGFLAELRLADDAVAYVADDLPDLPILQRCVLGFAVADAAPEVRAAAHVVLRAGGGQGAVREACERILKAKGSWLG